MIKLPVIPQKNKYSYVNQRTNEENDSTSDYPYEYENNDNTITKSTYKTNKSPSKIDYRNSNMNGVASNTIISRKKTNQVLDNTFDSFIDKKAENYTPYDKNKSMIVNDDGIDTYLDENMHLIRYFGKDPSYNRFRLKVNKMPIKDPIKSKAKLYNNDDIYPKKNHFKPQYQNDNYIPPIFNERTKKFNRPNTLDDNFEKKSLKNDEGWPIFLEDTNYNEEKYIYNILEYKDLRKNKIMQRENDNNYESFSAPLTNMASTLDNDIPSSEKKPDRAIEYKLKNIDHEIQQLKRSKERLKQLLEFENTIKKPYKKKFQYSKPQEKSNYYPSNSKPIEEISQIKEEFLKLKDELNKNNKTFIENLHDLKVLIDSPKKAEGINKDEKNKSFSIIKTPEKQINQENNYSAPYKPHNQSDHQISKPFFAFHRKDNNRRPSNSDEYLHNQNKNPKDYYYFGNALKLQKPTQSNINITKPSLNQNLPEGNSESSKKDILPSNETLPVNEISIQQQQHNNKKKLRALNRANRRRKGIKRKDRGNIEPTFKSKATN